MKIKTLFRVSIIAEWSLLVFGITLFSMLDSSLPDLLQQYQVFESERNMTLSDIIFLGIGIPVVLLNLISSIGLYFFRSWARPIYVATAVLSILVMIFSPPTVSTGIESAFEQFSILIGGVIIALMFYSDITDKFIRSEIKPQPIDRSSSSRVMT
jgi:hypothetical protein